MSSFAHNTLAAAHSEETSQSTRSSRHLGKVLVDTSTEYRAFLFAVHPQHGFLLLKCRDKKNKGSYWEIPGGHLDDEDFEQAADQVFVKPQQLDLAGKIGVARELFEESGIDIRGEVERLESAVLGSSENNSGAYASLQHLYKDRLFYFLRLEDTDFLPAGVVASGSEGLDLQVRQVH
jgi:8-oxo-dGTP pyrophosphatase MutT (NUDIX family)